MGYTAPGEGGKFQEKSSVQLRSIVKTNTDEAVRKAAWEGLRSLGPFVLENGLCEMVKLRNEMARKLGYEDYYDYKVTQAEGFGKKELFGILDTLLQVGEISILIFLTETVSYYTDNSYCTRSYTDIVY